jgi:hypothetical protein
MKLFFLYWWFSEFQCRVRWYQMAHCGPLVHPIRHRCSFNWSIVVPLSNPRSGRHSNGSVSSFKTRNRCVCCKEDVDVDECISIVEESFQCNFFVICCWLLFHHQSINYWHICGKSKRIEEKEKGESKLKNERMKSVFDIVCCVDWLIDWNPNTNEFYEWLE